MTQTRVGSRWLVTTLAVAAATVLGLESVRVFTTHVVWSLGETSNRTVLGLVALGGFLAAGLAWPLARGLGPRRARLVAFGLLAAAAVVGQISMWPWVDFGAGLAGTVAFGWTLILVISAAGRAGAVGVALALALDIMIRAALVTVDAPVAHAPTAAAVVAALAAGVALAARSVAGADLPLPAMARGWRVLSVGPGLALFMIVTGNFGQAAVPAGVDFRAAALWLGAGAAVGVLWTALHAASARPAARAHLLVAVLALAAGCALFAARPGVAAPAAALMGAGLPLVVGTCFAGGGTGRGVAPSATYGTLSLLLFTGLAFSFYSFYGPAWVMPVAVGITIAAALLSAAFPAKSAGDAVDLPPRLLAGGAAVLAAVICLPTAVAAVGVEPPVATGPADETSISVMTYNIRQGFGLEGRFDLEAVARTIEDNQADIVALQEVGRGWMISGGVDTLTWLSQRLELPYVYGANGGDLWGNAILSRIPMRARNEPLDNPGRVPRGVLRADFELPDTRLTVFNTHLDHEDDGRPTRLAQVGRIIELWGGWPRTLLVGDLNAKPEDPELSRLQEAGFRDADLTGLPTAPADHPTKRIDYVLATPDFRLRGIRRPSTEASDHLPVWVRLTPA